MVRNHGNYSLKYCFANKFKHPLTTASITILTSSAIIFQKKFKLEINWIGGRHLSQPQMLSPQIIFQYSKTVIWTDDKSRKLSFHSINFYKNFYNLQKNFRSRDFCLFSLFCLYFCCQAVTSDFFRYLLFILPDQPPGHWNSDPVDLRAAPD